MGKLKWVTKSVSFSCQGPPKSADRVSFRQLFSCYPFSLTRFGATELFRSWSDVLPPTYRVGGKVGAQACLCMWVRTHSSEDGRGWVGQESQQRGCSIVSIICMYVCFLPHSLLPPLPISFTLSLCSSLCQPRSLPLNPSIPLVSLFSLPLPLF